MTDYKEILRKKAIPNNISFLIIIFNSILITSITKIISTQGLFYDSTSKINKNEAISELFGIIDNNEYQIKNLNLVIRNFTFNETNGNLKNKILEYNNLFFKINNSILHKEYKYSIQKFSSKIIKNRFLQRSNCKVVNCKICLNKNSNNCSSCYDGYYLSQGTCLPCSTGCINCTSNKTCENCDSSKFYFLSNNSCSLCQKNCNHCDNKGNCLLCNYGFFLPNITNKSLNLINSCKACLPNCQTCISNSTCLTCNDYYLLDSTRKICSSCYQSDCINCATDGTCLNCKNGYYIDSESKCGKCNVPNCNLCNKNGLCASCNFEYFLYNKNTQCKKCSDFDQNCLSCSDNNLCTSCRENSYLYYEKIIDSNNYINSIVTCKRCEIGTYLKNKNSCGKCSDFGKCIECSTEGCSLCMPNSSPADFSSCVCDDGYVSIDQGCVSLLIIVIPITVCGFIIIITIYCIVKVRMKTFQQNRNVELANRDQNSNFNLNNNNVNNNRNENNNVNHINNINNNNPRNIRIALENKILNPLKSHDQVHGNKCIFGDDSPPFWEFDCGGYICNPCSLKLVTNFSSEYGICMKCSKTLQHFKFLNRFIESEDREILNNVNIIKIDSIKSDTLNISLNESQNDSICKICFVLKQSKQIKCDSNTPHMLCEYCYNRLIWIEQIEHCPFCRSSIHR